MTLVCITPSTRLAWVDAVRELRARGVASLAVVLEASTFGPAAASAGVLTALSTRGIPTRIVRNGDDLDQALRP